MSENITHFAVCEDCLRLMQNVTSISDAFKEVTKDHPDLARMGSVTRGTARFNLHLLERIRDGWAGRRPGEHLEAKLAYILGTVCHRAADLTMKPIFVAEAPEDQQQPTTVSIYHDIFAFREIYKEGFEKPYSPQMFGMASELEEHFRLLMQRALLALHTFIPDQSDPEGWLEKLFARRQQFYVDITRYAQAYTDPDPDEWRRYIVDVNYYDAGDGLIALARQVQNGDSIADSAVVEALTPGQNQSQYGQALLRGMRYLVAASEFFAGQVSVDSLQASWEFTDQEKSHA